ncbi:MAG TPA: CDP-glycerol glycerophosphotransferase family protein [Candidatus Saccharimonadales bacterium]|nr:CDP-glycerol glycerophosphotransferase family protein [Candidatus Saccharimonadales bacterium]
MNSLLLTIRIMSIRAVHAFARRLPLRRRVVLATAHAGRLGGNLAILRDELAGRTPPIPVVVLTHRPTGGWRGRMASLWHGVVAAYHLATSRVFIVDDYFFPIYVVRRRPATLVVQTWHACGAFKRFGYSVLDKSFGADAALAKRVRIHGNYDVCLVGSPTAAKHYAEAFRQPLERFVTHLGVPRTDVLFGEDRLARSAAAIRARYGIPTDKRVILYAPTFRGDKVTTARFSDTLDLARLHEVLGADHVILVRLHPFIRAAAPIDPALAAFAIDVSDHPDINELLPLSDLLVTDYSSVIFEYSLLGKPMAFFAPDVADYEDERGFYFDYRTGVPGPVFEDTEGLAEHLRAGVFDLERVAAFRATSFEVADGHATERVVDRIVLPALTG